MRRQIGQVLRIRSSRWPVPCLIDHFNGIARPAVNLNSRLSNENDVSCGVIRRLRSAFAARDRDPPSLSAPQTCRRGIEYARFTMRRLPFVLGPIYHGAVVAGLPRSFAQFQPSPVDDVPLRNHRATTAGELVISGW